jgi:GLPGLI family protein
MKPLIYIFLFIISSIHETFISTATAQLPFPHNRDIGQAFISAHYQVSFPTGVKTTFILLIGANYTLWIEKMRLAIDSIRFYNGNWMAMATNNPSSSKMKIVINRKTQVAHYFDRPLMQQLYYQESLNLGWEIEPVKKVINGINCQKATTNYGGREYIAWFSDKIPISSGPYKFNGLPGLILSIEDSESKFKFELTDLILHKINRPLNLYEKEQATKSSKLEIRQVYIALFKNPAFTVKSAIESSGAWASDNIYEKMKPMPLPEFLEILED